MQPREIKGVSLQGGSSAAVLYRCWPSVGISALGDLAEGEPGAFPAMGCAVGSAGSLQPFHEEGELCKLEKQRNIFHFLPLFH